MPRTSSPEPRWDGAPLDARHEIRLAVALPLVAAAAAAAALWSHLFATGPLRWWGTAIAGAVLAAALAGAVALCFRGRSRRRWKPATVFPIAIAVGVGALVPAFEQFALAHHGVSVECTVASRIDYIAETVFDPLGRVGPEFGDPSASGGLAFAPLTLLFLTAGASFRLYLVDDGSIRAALADRIRRLRGRV
ncbi:hypothetical protein [Glycomyces albidus]|uniref:Uncharacterized protein n=1 Tax=Glycomyces albidus TaxID=2656774 RepID=A0A6L5G3S4_9ACTN|nr:hypothetical protein [Glycomyces albidus]MQM24053.1 hypothetical protein [Glycomyces albidus]